MTQSPSMSSIVRFEIEAGVGIITLNRPDRLNALSDAMHGALDEAWVAAYQAREARVIVLTGAARAFCAGADLERLDHIAASRGGTYDLPRPGIVSPVFAGIDAPPETLGTYVFPLAMPKPVIAAVNGPCVGVGLLLAATCDIRFASTTAMFSAAFPQRALIAEGGLAWLMPRIVGRNFAADMLISGRRIDAAEAARQGLVSRVEAPEEMLAATLDYARTIAATASPRATRLIKQQLWHAYDQDFRTAAQDSHDLLLESLQTADFQEGLASFREERTPAFNDF